MTLKTILMVLATVWVIASAISIYLSIKGKLKWRWTVCVILAPAIINELIAILFALLKTIGMILLFVILGGYGLSRHPFFNTWWL